MMAERLLNKRSLPPPIPLGMIICDSVIRDRETGKPTLVGCFASMLVEKFPAVHPSLCVYVVVTDARGKVPFSLKLVDVEENKPPLFEGRFEAKVDDPKTVAEIVFNLEGLRFHGPGNYRFQLFAAGEFLMERRLEVIKRTNRQFKT